MTKQTKELVLIALLMSIALYVLMMSDFFVHGFSAPLYQNLEVLGGGLITMSGTITFFIIYTRGGPKLKRSVAVVSVCAVAVPDGLLERWLLHSTNLILGSIGTTSFILSMAIFAIGVWRLAEWLRPKKPTASAALLTKRKNS